MTKWENQALAGQQAIGSKQSNYHNFVWKQNLPPMPIFMDRHDIPGATAKDVAIAHQKDLAIQNDFNCRALTYWFDEESKKDVLAICYSLKDDIMRV